MKKKKIILQIVVSCVLFGIILVNIDFQSFLENFQQVRLYSFGVAGLVFVIAYLINSYKWQNILKSMQVKKSLLYLLLLNYIGVFYANVLPGQIAGEIAKGFKCEKKEGEGHKLWISIALDKITGLIGILLLGLCGILFYKYDSSQIKLILYSLIVFFSFFILWFSSPDYIGRLVMGFFRIIMKREEIVVALNNYFGLLTDFIKQRFSLIYTIILSVLFQIFVVLVRYFICLSVGIEISFISLIWIVSIVSILLMLPISISGFGVREGTFIYFFSFEGISDEKALFFSLTLFSMDALMGIIGFLVDVTLGSRKIRK